MLLSFKKCNCHIISINSGIITKTINAERGDFLNIYSENVKY